MAKDDSFSALSRHLSQAFDYPEGGAKNSQIKRFSTCCSKTDHGRSRPKDAFRDASGLKDEGVP